MEQIIDTTPTRGRRLAIDLGWTQLYRPEHVKREHVALCTEPGQCGKHGQFVATRWGLEPPMAGLPPFLSQCPTCDAELQAEADRRDGEIRGGVDAKAERLAAWFRRAGIPPRFEKCTIWNWTHGMDQQRRVWEWVRTWVAHLDVALQTGRSAVFAGAVGTGKTHLAIGMLRHVIEKGGTGLYVTVMGMLGRIKHTFQASASETEAAVIDELAKVDLLVVDEVGRSLDSNYEVAQFFRVLDLRYQWLKPTVLVTNLNREKFRAFVGDAMADRLRESGGALMLFDWASQRSGKARSADEGSE